MKPLVYYCRWNKASLRLRARDEKFLRGQLVFSPNDGEELVQDFRYEIVSATLTIFTDSGEQTLILDDMGVVTNQA